MLSPFVEVLCLILVLAHFKLYSEQIGLRNSTQLGVLWIPAFAGMTVIEFFANHSVWSIACERENGMWKIGYFLVRWLRSYFDEVQHERGLCLSVA